MLEVYPHPALLRLLHREYRVPYKARKAQKYWPGTSPDKRIELLVDEYREIIDALSDRVAAIGLQLPEPSSVPSISSLKRFEDAIDALISAWVGIEYLAGNAEPFGDHTCAIWIPKSQPRPSPFGLSVR